MKQLPPAFGACFVFSVSTKKERKKRFTTVVLQLECNGTGATVSTTCVIKSIFVFVRLAMIHTGINANTVYD